jgi:hypothetical protein
MDHPLHPKLGEYWFEVANLPLTVTRGVGTQSGDPTLIKKLREKSMGTPELTGRVLTTMVLTHERTGKPHKRVAHSFPTQDPPVRYR